MTENNTELGRKAVRKSFTFQNFCVDCHRMQEMSKHADFIDRTVTGHGGMRAI